MTRDYISIGNWCIDAHGVTAAELPEEIARSRLATINRHTGKSTIIQIAEDLSEGLSDLPSSQRLAAQDALRAKHGFGFDYFINRQQRKLVKIIARGKIRNETEHRAILDALSDTTLEPALASQLNALLISRESELEAA